MGYFVMSDQGKTSDPHETNAGIGIITDRVPEIKCVKCGCEIDVADVESFSKVECPDCHSIENVPAKLGPFLLESLIGTGGMGGVFRAKDESLGRFVALKVMLKSVGEKTAFVDYFKREAQAVAKLNHPSIVQIYSFGQEKGQPYIVMELVGGRRFDKMIDEPGTLSQALVMRIGLDVAEGLKAAEDIGLLHGDVKPENILLDEKGHAKLVDFGIATFANQGSQDGIWGTPYYVAPEKIKRQKVDQRSDIYSLGATIYHALTRHPPFEGKTPIDVVKARLQHKPKNPSALRADIDPEVESIVMRMLETEPSRRYPNYSSLIGDLRKVMQTLGDPKKFERDVIKKTGKIFITRKKDASSGTAPQAQLTPPPETKPQVGTKISFKKQKTIIAPGPAQAQYQTTRRDAPPSVPARPASPAAAQVPAKKKGGSASKIVVPLILVILVLIGSAVGYNQWKEKQKQDRIKKELLWSIADQQAKAKDGSLKIQQSGTKIAAMIKPAQLFADRATNAVFLATGNKMEMPASKPLDTVEAYRKFRKDKETPPEVVPDAGTNSSTNVTTSATNATTNAVAAAATPAAAAALQGKGPATNAVTAPAPEVKAAPAPAPAPEPKPAPAEEKPKEPAQPESEVEAAARAVLQDAVAVNDLAAAAKELSEYCTNVCLVEINQLKLVPKLIEKNKDIDKLVELATAMETTARATVEKMGPATKKVEELKTKAIKEEERRKKEKEEADRLAAEEKAKAQAIEDHKKLVENEKKLADTAHQNVADLFKQCKYKEAADKLQKDMSDYKTEEGKSALKAYVDRFTRLAKFKEYLTKQLNEDLFKWGFGNTLANSIDIAGADETGVKLKTKTVPWADISNEQWKRFFKRYIDDAKGLQQRVAGDGKMAAAIYHAETGNMQLAGDYARAAVDTVPSLQSEVKRLLPELSPKKEE